MKRFAEFTLRRGIQTVCHASCVLLLTLAGCSFCGRFKHGSHVDPVAAISFWKPHLLFIQPEPYARLCVEVDAVEGVVPEDDNLSRLRDFLAAHCAKPGGIEIVRDSLIPRDQARGLPREALARKYMTGPRQETSAPPAAFIYVLFYDTALACETVTQATPTTGRNPSVRPPVVPAKPFASLLPYPAAVFVDPNILGTSRTYKLSLLVGTFLQHEAGHLLGIGRNPAHAAGGHCLDKSCLMYWQGDTGELLLQEFAADVPGFDGAPRTRLCARCEADAQANAGQPSPTNLRFVGPVVVRLEVGYQVLTLPDRIKVVVGEFCEEDAWEFARTAQNDADAAINNDPVLVSGVMKPEARQDPAQFRTTLKRVRQDPLERVRQWAKRL